MKPCRNSHQDKFLEMKSMGRRTCPSEGFDINCEFVFPQEFVLVSLPFSHALYWQPPSELSDRSFLPHGCQDWLSLDPYSVEDLC